MVAFHFPPQAGSSGLLRALKFCRYFPEFGWHPTVLTVHPRAYEHVDESQLRELPSEVPVLRVFALDTQRHLSIRGRYLRWMALPDRWVTWSLGAIPAGWRAIRREKIGVIWTTFPIATAILIGWVLHRLTGAQWVVDFRDSMTEDEYPRDPLTRRIYRWIEKRAVDRAALLVFTARSTIQMYLQRYPSLSAEKCMLIPNGYDEADFQDILRRAAPSGNIGNAVRLVHMGLLYPEERDPKPFFRALMRLKKESRISAATLRIELRASGYDEVYASLTRELGIEDIVFLLPALPYHEALSDCARADGLLLFQAANCDHQIPAKAYEYLRVGKPILALTSQTGDTAALLREIGGATLVDLADEDAIYRALPSYLESLRSGGHDLPDGQKASQYSRKAQAQEVAKCFSQLESGTAASQAMGWAER